MRVRFPSPSRSALLLLTAIVSLLMFGRPLFAEEPGGEAAPGDKPDPGLFWHIVESAGPVFGPLLLIMSMALVALIVMLALDLRMSTVVPPSFVEQFTALVNGRKFKEAFELARGDKSLLGRVMTGGMSRLQYGLEDARDAAMNTLDNLKSSKDQLNNYIAVTGSLGPLIGLVGTVYGMIISFKVLAHSSSGVNASALAGGISHALVITMLGIGLAVPAVFFNTYFKNRITQITLDVLNLADDLLTQMYHLSKKPGSAAPQAATPAAGVAKSPV